VISSIGHIIGVRLHLSSVAPLAPASRVYLERVFPDCSERRLAIEPATIFDPRVVVIHLQRRKERNLAAAPYFNELVNEGIAELWEMGDPDMDAPDEPEVEEFDGELVHRRPDSKRLRSPCVRAPAT